MIGRRFGSLVVIERAPNNRWNKRMWLCQCDCGNTTIVGGNELRRGKTKTCGHCEKYEPADEQSMVCRLPNGSEFFFDNEDLPFIEQHRWHMDKDGYVETCLTGGIHLKLHRELLNAPPDKMVDHKDGNPANNRRSNLRLCNRVENLRNQGLRKNKTGYKGVTYNPRSNKPYVASIGVDGHMIRIMGFSNPIDAALAYDRKARELFGEFACTNFGNEGRSIYGSREGHEKEILEPAGAQDQGPIGQ